MTKKSKLTQAIMDGKAISIREAMSVLSTLGFVMNIEGSHYVFKKPGYGKNISLKTRKELLPYQMKMLQEVLKDHGY